VLAWKLPKARPASLSTPELCKTSLRRSLSSARLLASKIPTVRLARTGSLLLCTPSTLSTPTSWPVTVSCKSPRSTWIYCLPSTLVPRLLSKESSLPTERSLWYLKYRDSPLLLLVLLFQWPLTLLLHLHHLLPETLTHPVEVSCQHQLPTVLQMLTLLRVPLNPLLYQTHTHLQRKLTPLKDTSLSRLQHTASQDLMEHQLLPWHLLVV
jgi:hypothetical protein